MRTTISFNIKLQNDFKESDMDAMNEWTGHGYIISL